MKAVVTGGAGFIGSHLVDALLVEGYEVVVIDDLSTGLKSNINAGASFVEASITQELVVRSALSGVDVVFHQAALGSVQRSVENPLLSDTVNAHGTLIVLKAAVDAGVRRVIYASSSSVYGGATILPTPEIAPAIPRSPYAVTKFAGEQYCRVFAELFGLETVALRYFNIFGPRQRPDSAYAAVIPLFIDAVLLGRQPRVHGDGNQSRDLTFVGNAVRANILAATAPGSTCSGKVYNVGAGGSHAILGLLALIGRLIGREAQPIFCAPRPGDIRDSQADIRAAKTDLGYKPVVGLEEGLSKTLDWFKAAQTSSGLPTLKMERSATESG